MICHSLECIFVHVPKCGGSSIKDAFFDGEKLDWRKPDYEKLYGWCPKRKIHMQHATAKQLVELELVPEHVWNKYFKFAIVRNPWDRSYSDFLWIKKDCRIKSRSFEDYINASGPFEGVLRNRSTMQYRGDHLIPQSEFFDESGTYSMDWVGRFENYKNVVQSLSQRFGSKFDKHEKKNTSKLKHYSLFYTNSRKTLVESKFNQDIGRFDYTFEDRRTGLNSWRKLF